MEVYRLSRAMYASPLSGKGAALKGARWNSVGVELIYTAANRSLAMAEVAVHLTLATLPDDYVMMTLFVPDDISLKKVNMADLPDGWNVFPHPLATKKMGDQFVAANKFCVLQVPSSVTQGDYNLLINPAHPHFKRIQVLEMMKFPFDKRLF
jgi:RES domain-containing protein